MSSNETGMSAALEAHMSYLDHPTADTQAAFEVAWTAMEMQTRYTIASHLQTWPRRHRPRLGVDLHAVDIWRQGHLHPTPSPSRWWP